jgi:hypothetical protein
MTPPTTTRPLWRFPHQHRFTKAEMRQVGDAIGTYAYQWGLIRVLPFHEVKRARHSRHTDSGFDGWDLLYAEIRPVARLLETLANAKGGHSLPTWLALRADGFRPIVEGSSKAWTFRAGSAPLDYLHEIEPLPTRRGIATISRWTWCRGCDAELAVTAHGWCETCAAAAVSWTPPTVAPIGAPLGYVPEVGP